MRLLSSPLRLFLFLLSAWPLCFPVALLHADDSVANSVNAVTGLAPVLTLTCTDVDFGVWRIPVRTVALPTTVALSVASSMANIATLLTLGGETGFVARESSYDDVTVGICVVKGSSHPGQLIQVRIENNQDLSLAASDRDRLPRPAQAADVRATLSLEASTVQIDSLGEGTFRVVGELSLPPAIIKDNYGGYTTLAAPGGQAAEVIITDQVQTFP